jgi:phenylpropionate dioxygenase-like ring-hydroxylating dioxygenase large terminal subunit
MRTQEKVLPGRRLETGPMCHELDLAPEDMSVDTERYWSLDYQQRELHGLWLKVWQVACRVDDVAKPGSYFEYRLFDQSYLIVRGKDGKLRGFVNACRHRGNQLCNGRGTASQLVCQFHMWKYDLDGTLLKISDEDTFFPMDKSALGLLEVPVDTFAGFVFLNPDPNASSLQEYLGDLIPMLEPYHMDEMIPVGLNVRTPLACNWKVGVEAFVEQYHLHAVHPQLLPFVNDSDMHYGFFGDHSAFTVPSVSPSPRARVNESDTSAVADRMIKAFASIAQVFSSNEVRNPLADRIARYRDDNGCVTLPAGLTLRSLYQQVVREEGESQGQDFSRLTDDQMSDGQSWLIFPNTKLTLRAGEVLYIRFLPDPGGDPNCCIWESANYRWVPESDRERLYTHQTDVPDDQSLGLIMDQDRGQMPRQQIGLRSKLLKRVYFSKQEARNVHFQKTLDRYLASVTPEAIRAAEEGRGSCDDSKACQHP